MLGCIFCRYDSIGVYLQDRFELVLCLVVKHTRATSSSQKPEVPNTTTTQAESPLSRQEPKRQRLNKHAVQNELFKVPANDSERNTEAERKEEEKDK